METFGEYLKAQREKKSIRLEEIASITKIHLHSLELLEADEWGALPPEPFIRGFILAYAKYVGLDPKDTLARYHESMGRKVESAENGANSSAPRLSQENPSDVIQNPRQLPWNKIFAGFGAVAVVALIALFITVGKRNSESQPVVENSPPPVMDTNPAPPAPAVENPVAAAPSTPETAPATGNNEVPPNPDRIALIPAPAAPVAAAVAPNAQSPEAARTTAGVTEPAPATPPTTPSSEFKHELMVEGQERTWIKVVIDDKAPVEYFLPKGEKTTYQAKEKIKVVLGNSAGSKVTHNGELAKGKKFQGTIRYYVFPENARFPQDVGAKRNTAKAEGEETASNGETPSENSEEKKED